MRFKLSDFAVHGIFFRLFQNDGSTLDQRPNAVHYLDHMRGECDKIKRPRTTRPCDEVGRRAANSGEPAAAEMKGQPPSSAPRSAWTSRRCPTTGTDFAFIPLKPERRPIEEGHMFVETIKSDGLAHLSYLVGSEGVAAVIDPRRDCQIYIENARKRGCRIDYVFETHRNEDLVSGAPLLARLTGARVCHGPNAAGDVRYAETTHEGDRYTIGQCRIEVLETPGHTDDSLSFALFDDETGGDAVGVFTGDALFVGDVGRTDFYPDRATEVAGLLYDSLQKLFALGDQAIVYPAHGSGSVCGDGMASREFSTLGHERRSNPSARIRDRDTFIEKKLAEHHDQPPYFRLMERLNLEGAEGFEEEMLRPPILQAEEFEDAREQATVVDVRGIADFIGAHMPGSLCLPEDMVTAFAGWLLQADEELLVVAADLPQAKSTLRHLYRIGHDRVRGMLLTPISGWASGDREFRQLAVVDREEVARRVAGQPEDWSLLDVRDANETAEGVIPGAQTIYLGNLPEHIDALDRSQRITVVCESGARASIGASLLLREGFRNVDVFLGAMGAWEESGGDLADGR
ncbi:MAG: MBL fold metallo-hydrolase [Xanthomonadales bacterium]